MARTVIALVSPASPNAEDSQALYAIALIVALALVVAVNLAILYAARAFRAGRDRAPSEVSGGPRVQLLVAGAAAAGAAVMLALGFAFLDSVRSPEPSGPRGLEVRVSGQQWLWRFEYDDETFSYGELVVPVDTTVLLDIGSTDVVHTWWVPALGGKFDAVPGSVNRTWFKAEREGVYRGRSATFSGPGYAAMRATVRAVGVPEFKAWLERRRADIATAQAAVVRTLEARRRPRPAGQGA